MERLPDDWSEMDDLDSVESSTEPATFLEAAAQFAAKPAQQVTCYACQGSKVFRSKFTGRIVGDCFACGGTGLVSPRAAKSHATRSANKAKAEAAKLDRITQFTAAHKDVLAFLGARADRWDFARSLLLTFANTGTLSPGQLAAAYRCMESDQARQQARQATIAATEPQGSGLDLSALPAGRYAVPNGDTRLKVLIARPAPPSQYAGYIFVSDAAEYGSRTKFGRQAPGKTYTGKIQAELTEIVKDPKAAAAAYGKLTGTCGVCGRHLEDAESIARGIGPICASRF